EVGTIELEHPVDQVNTAWHSVVSEDVNRGVVTRDDCVGVVSEIPCEPQNISIERCRVLYIRHMQHGIALHELRKIRGGQCWHDRPSYVDPDTLGALQANPFGTLLTHVRRITTCRSPAARARQIDTARY